MRIVLDTNVLVSGLLNPHGPPGRIVDAVLAGGITLLVDDRIIAEYKDVLSRPRFGFVSTDVRTLTAFLETVTEHIAASPMSLKLKDPSDLPFVEVAVCGAADALVTGNTRHFAFDKRKTALAVVSPADFMAELAALPLN